MRTWAYVDGFNLYNGALKGTPFRWLDLLSLCRQLVPRDTVEHVKYFTALVRGRAGNPDSPIRQQIYWRALRSCPEIEIIEGYFLARCKNLPTCSSVTHIENLAATGASVVGMKPKMVPVWRSEEKGTDVNLAAHLVNDAHRDRFDLALVISNDSDLTQAISIVKNELGKVVGVYTPHRGTPSVQLKKTASFFREIRNSNLRTSLFADPLTDAGGSFSKPAIW